MKVKQVIVAIRASGGAAKRLVFDAAGTRVVGDSALLDFPGVRTVQIVVRGSAGESIGATLTPGGNCVAGDIVVVAKALEGYSNESIAAFIEHIPRSHGSNSTSRAAERSSATVEHYRWPPTPSSESSSAPAEESIFVSEGAGGVDPGHDAGNQGSE